MALAQSEADASTYGALRWQDASGNLYAAASFIARPEWLVGASQPLKHPEWDTGKIIDMQAAGRAQAKMVVWLGDPEQPIPQANPNALTIVANDSGLEALAAMGLKIIEMETDD
jgi:hypothetical protein